MLYEIDRLSIVSKPIDVINSCTEKIYVFEYISKCSDELFRKAYNLISEERRNRVDKYVFRTDKILSCFAEILLMYGLYEMHSLCKPAEVVRSKYGKPYLKDYDNIKFNISHCKDGLVCGFSQKEIGVDIQDIIRFDESLAEFICSSEEYEQIKNSDKKGEALTKIWSIKEAYLKWRGIGITNGVKDIESYCVINSNELYFYIYKNEKYVAVFCASNKIDSFVKLSIENMEKIIAKLEQFSGYSPSFKHNMDFS